MTKRGRAQLRASVDALSLVPVLGVPADVVSALLSLKDRDYVGAALAVGGIFFEGFDAARIGKQGVEAVLHTAFTKSNFRKNLQKLTGLSEEAIKGLEAHHVFPQALERYFKPIGINIHDPRFGAWVKKGEHQSWSYDYEQEWRAFFRKYEGDRYPTLEEVFAEAERLARKFGYEWRRP